MFDLSHISSNMKSANWMILDLRSIKFQRQAVLYYGPSDVKTFFTPESKICTRTLQVETDGPISRL